MKKVKFLSVVFAIILIFQISPVHAFTVSNNTLSTQELNALNFYDKELCNNQQVISLKNSNQLDGFIKKLNDEYNVLEHQDYLDKMEIMSLWEITADDTFKDIAVMAQTYLDNHCGGIIIGTKEFNEYVENSLLGDGDGIFRRAQENKEFGPLYLYMCLYYEQLKNNTDYLDVIKSGSRNKGFEELTISEIIQYDFKYNFSETTIPIILREYSNSVLENSRNAWPRLSDEKIEEYARRHAESPNNANYINLGDEDCTNFVSQALFYGYLPKTYINPNDKNHDGYVDTEDRWFYFNNNSNSGYSISTSWVRVVELYNYLAPHYATYEARANSNVNPYLNKGFVLQGKPLIGGYRHSVIVTHHPETGQLSYCAHSNPRKDAAISIFYDGFYKCRVIQTY